MAVSIDWEPEHAALTGGAGLVDLSARTQIELTGDDRASFLHNLSTNEIRKLPVGGGCELMLLDAKGHIVGHGYVFCRATSLVLDTVPGQGAKLVAHLDRYLIREKVELHDRSETWGDLLLAGPRSGEVLAKLLDAPLPEARLANVDGQIAGRAVNVRRVDFTQPGGYLISCVRDDVETLRTALREAGAMPCSPAAFEAARIEAGTPYYGQDMTTDNLPQELGRDSQAISFVKGCYIGQETVARIDALGHVNKTLVGAALSGDTVPAIGDELTVNDKSVGQVTSATFSPKLHAPLALAYVRRGNNAPGNIVQWQGIEGRVVTLPL